MAYIKVTSVTETTISVKLNGLDTAYVSSDRVCTWYLNGVRKGTSKLGAKVSTGGDFVFKNLTAGTSYDISVDITAPSWTMKVSLDASATTEKAKITPWSWTASNGKASSSQTQAAYRAVRYNGYLSSFSYLVWNDMADKVKEILDANKQSWDSSFASFAATKMSNRDKTLTASRFNALRHNIGQHYPTGIYPVSRGDTVYGWYFITLANCINYWIG